MPAYSGKFQHLDAGGAVLQQGACETRFDAETLTVTPQAGTPLVLDLGDVDVVAPADWDLTLRLDGGGRIELRQFGAAFGRMCQELVAAWRDRTVRCLLLEDLAEVGRFQGTANGEPAEIRIYGSNLAVLPLGGRPIAWRLAELDSIAFDDSTYTFNLLSGAARLAIGRLAKKNDEFGDQLRATADALRRHAAEALRRMFPFLDPGQLQRLVALAPEGRSVKLAALAAVDARLPEALVSRAVDEAQKPYFDFLKARAAPDSLMTGFKFVRPDAAAAQPSGGPPSGGAGDVGDTRDAGAAVDGMPPVFFWFFFPLADRPVAAWECASGGRATYFFRAAPPAEESIARLTRGLAQVNFHREPVYLPDESLEREATFHRYAIGRRKLPELQELRSAFLGRAVHASMEGWQRQVAQASESRS